MTDERTGADDVPRSMCSGEWMTDEWTEADDAIEEVWEIRRQILARFDNDWRKMLEYYIERDKHYTGPTIEPPERILRFDRLRLIRHGLAKGNWRRALDRRSFGRRHRLRPQYGLGGASLRMTVARS